jgi:hypothetical protein
MNLVYAKLGFPSPHPVETLRSIAHLFASTKKGSRCGIYLLALMDGTHYIGQTIEVVRRFAQHCSQHEIVGFSFIRAKQAELSQLEREKIYLAESLGLRLTNFIHTTVVAGQTDLDLVVPEAEQEKWVRSGQDCFHRDHSPSIVLPHAHLDRYATRFKVFQFHPQSTLAVDLLRKYLINCIVAPRRTEYSFWNVSCLPSTGRGDLERLFCVSAASMELFVLMCHKRNKKDLHGYVTISEEALCMMIPDPDDFKKKHPTVEFTIVPYRDAGEDQITLAVWGETPLKRLLDDEAVQIAGSILALRVMRKRPTFYAQYHCAQLAQLALGTSAKRRPRKSV